jgi:hypothetical protein
MAHVHDPVIQPSRADIAARAREIHLGPLLSRTALTTTLFLLASAGWLVGTAWFLLVFSVLWLFNHVKWAGQAVRYGYHKGARHEMVPNREL